MYSFLNDSELYGAPLVAPSKPPSHQAAPSPAEKTRSPDEREGTPLTLEVFLKAIGHLEKRLFSLEERLLTNHQSLERRLEEKRAYRTDVSWIQVAVFTISVAVVLCIFFRRPQPAPTTSLPTEIPQVSPPTPIFVLPSSFIR
jgi:hypothetical protein